MSFFGFVKSAVGLAAKVLAFVKGAAPSTTEVFGFAAGNVFTYFQQALAYGHLDSKEKFDSWLDTLDASTGDDAGAVGVIPNMDAKQEETFWDHIKEALRCLGYAHLRVPGWYQE